MHIPRMTPSLTYGPVASMALSILLTAVGCASTPVPAAPGDTGSTNSSWVMGEMSEQDWRATQAERASLSQLWFFPVRFDVKTEEFKWTQGLPAGFTPKESAGSGVAIANTGTYGFDPALGARIVHAPRKTWIHLLDRMQRDGWSSLQLDLENLSENEAEPFERLVSDLSELCHKRNLKFSVTLHAQTGSGPAPFEGARFQRWEKLKSVSADWVLMAYDYHWSTSAPGAIAPLDWVLQVALHAKSIFSQDDIVVALPQFGYLWSPKQKPTSWQGEPLSARQLNERTADRKQWKLVGKFPKTDGLRAENGSQVAVWDSKESCLIKRQALEKLGFKHFAYWRLQ